MTFTVRYYEVTVQFTLLCCGSCCNRSCCFFLVLFDMLCLPGFPGLCRSLLRCCRSLPCRCRRLLLRECNAEGQGKRHCREKSDDLFHRYSPPFCFRLYNTFCSLLLSCQYTVTQPFDKGLMPKKHYMAKLSILNRVSFCMLRYLRRRSPGRSNHARSLA